MLSCAAGGTDAEVVLSDDVDPVERLEVVNVPEVVEVLDVLVAMTAVEDTRLEVLEEPYGRAVPAIRAPATMMTTMTDTKTKTAVLRRDILGSVCTITYHLERPHPTGRTEKARQCIKYGSPPNFIRNGLLH